MRNHRTQDLISSLRPWAGGIVVLPILALAAFFRLFRIDSIPPGLWRDEARNGVDAVGILHGVTPIFFEEKEPLFIYADAVSVALLGQTDVALRLISVLMGVASVGFVYLLASRMFGRWTGILAALGLATSFWAVDINRLGFRANGVPFFALLSFLFLWIGLTRIKSTKSRFSLLWPFVLSGAFLSGGLYSYLSARMLPLVFILFITWLIVWREVPWRWGLFFLFTVGAVSLLVFLPLGLYFLAHLDDLMFRASGTSFFGSGPGTYTGLPSLLANISSTLGMFASQGDTNWRHNILFPRCLTLFRRCSSPLGSSTHSFGFASGNMPSSCSGCSLCSCREYCPSKALIS